MHSVRPLMQDLAILPSKRQVDGTLVLTTWQHDCLTFRLNSGGVYENC